MEGTMANREACELYIEQEIDLALQEGKKPYSIGKEIAGMVERLFEAKMSPNTLKTRAYRQQKGNGSNEPKQSKDAENIADTKPEILKNRHPQGGGAREGSGRPQTIDVQTEKTDHELFRTPSQKRSWTTAENRLSKVVEYILDNCEITNEMHTETKQRFFRNIDTLNTIREQMEKEAL